MAARLFLLTMLPTIRYTVVTCNGPCYLVLRVFL